jgi:tetratricopeptide (TPR) repeat protein
VLSSFLKDVLGSRARASRRHAAALERGYAAYAAHRYSEACEAGDAALRALPDSAAASYLVGLCACAAGDAQSAALALEHAVEFGDGSAGYIAALADARLLQQREDDAEALYRRAFPAIARDIDGMPEPPSPWKKAHPVWTSRLRNLTLPRPSASMEPRSWRPGALDDTRAAHVLNWGLLLIRRRRARAGMHLIGEALRTDPALGYGHAALSLMHTLDQAWPDALASGLAARELGAEVFPGATDLCIASAQLALRRTGDDPDPVFDWRPIESAFDDRHLDGLPRLEGLPFPDFPSCALVYFIACDTAYLLQHAVALIHSIRKHCGAAAIHLHLFDPGTEAWEAIEALRAAVRPLPLSVTWERVSFDDYSSKALYCSCARFARLYELVQHTGNTVVMLDADSLVRGDLAAALADAGEIALVRAEHEPPWHRYLAGFCVFRKSEASTRFLRELSAFLTANLASGRPLRYLDQVGLYACGLRLEAQDTHIDHLPVGKFCDTLFSDDALVWSVTQGKDDDSRFAIYKRSVLAPQG